MIPRDDYRYIQDYTEEDLEEIRNMPAVTDEEADMVLVEACIQTGQHPKDVGLGRITPLWEREMAKRKKHRKNRYL